MSHVGKNTCSKWLLLRVDRLLCWMLGGFISDDYLRIKVVLAGPTSAIPGAR